jgi:hypothetical protein
MQNTASRIGRLFTSVNKAVSKRLLRQDLWLGIGPRRSLIMQNGMRWMAMLLLTYI